MREAETCEDFAGAGLERVATELFEAGLRFTERIDELFEAVGVRGLGATETDLAIRRRIVLNDRFSVTISGEAFNVFNHWNPQAPSAGSPTGTTGSQNLGLITGASLSGIIPVQTDPRVLQFALKFHW